MGLAFCPSGVCIALTQLRIPSLRPKGPRRGIPALYGGRGTRSPVGLSPVGLHFPVPPAWAITLIIGADIWPGHLWISPDVVRYSQAACLFPSKRCRDISYFEARDPSVTAELHLEPSEPVVNERLFVFERDLPHGIQVTPGPWNAEVGSQAAHGVDTQLVLRLLWSASTRISPGWSSVARLPLSFWGPFWAARSWVV